MSGHNANKAITGYWLPTDRGAAADAGAANRNHPFDALHWPLAGSLQSEHDAVVVTFLALVTGTPCVGCQGVEA